MPELNPNWVPKRGVFEATLGCNLCCRHCGSRAGKKRDNELTTQECADLFSQLGAMGMEWLTISGGEPMTRSDWPELIAAATAAGVRTGMITNAVALDRDAIRLAKQNGLCGVGLSLDGVGQTHDYVRGRIGHFKRITDAMDDCRAEGMPFSVITHLNRRNLGEIDAMHALIEENGAYAWQVQLGTDMGNMSDNRDLLVKRPELIDIEATLGRIIKKSRMRVHPSDSIGYYGPHEKLLRKASKGTGFKGCGAGLRVIGIESNGNIKGCLSIQPGYNARSDEWVEGNIRENSVRDIWFKEGAFAYNRQWSVEQMGGFCASCDKVRVCRGGCVSKRVASGDGVENPMCVYRAISEESRGHGIAAAAAAVALAGLLGGVACDNVDDPAPEYGAPAPTDTSTTADYGVPSTDPSDTETAVLEYGIPETDTPAYGFPEYGFPDTATETASTDQTDYGIPDTATDTYPMDTDYSAQPFDTETTIDTFDMDYGVPSPEPKK